MCPKCCISRRVDLQAEELVDIVEIWEELFLQAMLQELCERESLDVDTYLELSRVTHNFLHEFVWWAKVEFQCHLARLEFHILKGARWLGWQEVIESLDEVEE